LLKLYQLFERATDTVFVNEIVQLSDQSLKRANSPDSTWMSGIRGNNPEPWNQLDPTYQYKFVAIDTDYKNLKKEGPQF
uniref:Uncharacterized protein n=1 Tax=Oncorhynchus mykiss TaxID=8022 RepID=A0A8K9UDP9_ONCMY